MVASSIPVQLLGPLDNLLFVSSTALRRSLSLTLEGKVCLLHLHGSVRPRYTQPEIRIIEHLNRKVNRLRPEIDHQGFALESALLIRVHLDALSAAVNFLGDDATFGECVSNLFKAGIERD